MMLMKQERNKDILHNKDVHALVHPGDEHGMPISVNQRRLGGVEHHQITGYKHMHLGHNLDGYSTWCVLSTVLVEGILCTWK